MSKPVDLNSLVAYGASLLELGGFIVGVSRWRRIGLGQRAVTLWFGGAATCDVATFLTARHMRNAQPVAHVWYAISVILGIESLASYQSSRKLVAVLRCFAGAYLATWMALVATVEPLGGLSTYLAPLHALVILFAASATLLRRGLFGRTEVLADPGFLVAAGLAGYAVSVLFQTLIAQLLEDTAPVQYSMRYYTLCNILVALAEVMLIMALLLPTARTRIRLA